MENQKLVTTWEDAEILFKQIEACEVYTYDAETSGLDWKRNHVVGHVIKPLGLPSYYVPVRHAGGGNFEGCRVPATEDGWRGDLHPFEVQLAKILRGSPRRTVGHNLAFDLKFAHRVGIEFYGDLEDTQVNAALLDENMRSFSLENVAKWCEVTDKKGDDLYAHIGELVGCAPDRKSMAHYWKTNGSEFVVWDYASGDGISTEEVWVKQNMFIDEENLNKVHGVENRLIRTLHRITLHGIRIDEAELERVDKLFADKESELLQAFPPGFRTNAPSDIKKFLEHRIDEDWPRTPGGALQFNEKALAKVPEGRQILDARKLAHARSAFTGPMKETHLHNGRVHCEFNQMKADDYGTVSGRLSSSNPNMQQVPKRDKFIGKEYRKCFLPDEGHVWYDNDYKQQEYVVFTDYTRNPRLVAGYMADPPVDVHQSVAEMMGVERDPTAKRMNLGILYGMGREALAGHLGVTVAQAIEWQNQYHAQLPEAKKFLKNAEQRARTRGFVFTYLGRKRRFPDRRFAHKAGNGVIQGSSADITKLKMVEVDDYFQSIGDEFHLLLQCHDSLSWTGPDKPEIDEEARRIMQAFGPDDVITLGIPLRVDHDRGPNWSVATYGV